MARPSEPKKRRRERGDDGISWDKVNKCYIGTISPGFKSDGKRGRRTIRGRTKQDVKDKLDGEIKAGVQTLAMADMKQNPQLAPDILPGQRPTGVVRVVDLV